MRNVLIVLAGLMVLGGIFVLVILAFVMNGGRLPSEAASGPNNEPCSFEAPESARGAGENWCREGAFTRVKVSNDADNFVATLQFSSQGQQSWTNGNKYSILNRFRHLTDEVVEKADLIAAFSLFDMDGEMHRLPRRRDRAKGRPSAKHVRPGARES